MRGFQVFQQSFRFLFHIVSNVDHQFFPALQGQDQIFNVIIPSPGAEPAHHGADPAADLPDPGIGNVIPAKAVFPEQHRTAGPHLGKGRCGGKLCIQLGLLLGLMAGIALW